MNFSSIIIKVTLFVCYINISATCQESNSALTFEVDYQWTFLNFTWDNENIYQDAIDTGKYIPENNAMTGIKFYKDKLYIATPRIRQGTPVTFGYITRDENTPKENPLITPFPDWETNTLDGDCSKLQSVQSMEIDAEGIIWVLDGHRTRSSTCPSKLVLYDLNDGFKQVHTFVFPEEITPSSGGFLNDLVVDDEDGGFAYITEHSSTDPALVVYSREKNRAWKIRDASMFAEVRAAHFTVDNRQSDGLAPVDGIALSHHNGDRQVYYCALTAFGLYSISTKILKNEDQFTGGDWRYDVTYIGDKQAQSDGMVIDSEGNLFYGLLPLDGVGKWNIGEDFETAAIVDANNSTMIWTDSFGFDDDGYLYLLTNHIMRYFDSSYPLELTEEVKFRVLKLYTGTKSYLY